MIWSSGYSYWFVLKQNKRQLSANSRCRRSSWLLGNGLYHTYSCLICRCFQNIIAPWEMSYIFRAKQTMVWRRRTAQEFVSSTPCEVRLQRTHCLRLHVHKMKILYQVSQGLFFLSIIIVPDLRSKHAGSKMAEGTSVVQDVLSAVQRLLVGERS